jgi:3-phenylpropionate/trans-cinnamate dioxygenase ferredoxin reductase subunit
MTSYAHGKAGVLIVGASQAGVQLATSLRDFGYSEPITLIGAERHAPYQRPPLSKRALKNSPTPEALQFRSESFYESQGITLALDRRITHADKNEDGSGVAWTHRGEAISFDRLALTVGARPRRLQIPGADLSGVVTLRSVDQAAELYGRLNAGHRIVVIGGGFIGLEVAATARQLGKEVTVVLSSDKLMARAVGAPVSDFFYNAHLRRGVDIQLSSRPTAFIDDGNGSVGAVELEDGRRLPCDLVVLGVGATPRTELAEHLGLEVAGGIIVDERCLTSDGRTVAAGDCVVCPNPVDWHDGPIRFESVNTAIEQAKVAAATLAGAVAAYCTVPWFWSDQDSLKLQVTGLNAGYDRMVIRGVPADEAFTVLYYRQDRLISAECVNRPSDFMAAKSALNSGRSIDPDRAADVTTPLKHLLCDVLQTAGG